MKAIDRILSGEDISEVLETTTVANIGLTVSQMPGHKQYSTKPIHKKKRKVKKNARDSRESEA